MGSLCDASGAGAPGAVTPTSGTPTGQAFAVTIRANSAARARIGVILRAFCEQHLGRRRQNIFDQGVGQMIHGVV